MWKEAVMAYSRHYLKLEVLRKTTYTLVKTDGPVPGPLNMN
jgi:hypothetical protein